MKFLIVFLAVVAIAHAEFTAEQEAKWQDFKMKHGKLFLSPGKEKDRKKTFLSNVDDVESHNEAFLNGDVTFTKQLHQHSDLSDEAFIAKFGGVRLPADANKADKTVRTALRGTPPSSLDMRLQAGVGTVRNQAQCGSCWAFSTLAAVEYGFWRRTGKTVDLSEQQLVDCTYGTAGGCQGGWMSEAMTYIANAGGVTLENNYPYNAVSGTCKGASVPKAVKLTSTGPSYTFANDDNTIKNILNDYGVISVCVDASGLSSYSSGIFVSGKYTGTLTCTHAVALVGYGTSSAGIPFWIIRNSWGDWWGEKGYIRLDARRHTNGNIMGGLIPKHNIIPLF